MPSFFGSGANPLQYLLMGCRNRVLVQRFSRDSRRAYRGVQSGMQYVLHGCPDLGISENGGPSLEDVLSRSGVLVQPVPVACDGPRVELSSWNSGGKRPPSVALAQ